MAFKVVQGIEKDALFSNIFYETNCLITITIPYI